MTKAEAIAMLKRIQEPEAWEPQINQAAFEALGMEIKALEQQPCEDTISRQVAIEKISETIWDTAVANDVKTILKELPSAQPSAHQERMMGRWVPVTNGRGGYECDQCHNYAPSYQDGAEWLSDFCPNCGADMRGEQDG